MPYKITTMQHEEFNHPQWRQPEWSMLDQNLRDSFEADMRLILLMMPLEMQQVKMYLIAGFAYGTAHAWSDIDIVFAPDDDLLADGLRVKYALSAKSQFPEVIDALNKISQKYMIRIQVSWGLCPKHVICYCFDEKLWYGKNAGEIVNKRNSYDFLSKSYKINLVPPIDINTRFSTLLVDPWQP